MEQDTHNINKFKSQRIDQYKVLRVEKFKDLDAEYFKALESDDVEKMKQIAEHKNKLRNLQEYEFPEFDDARAILDHIPDFLL